MEAGLKIDGSLTEVGELRLEVANLKRRLGHREYALEVAKESAKRADERANNYKLLADSRLDYVKFLQGQVASLRGRICDLADAVSELKSAR